MTYFKHIINGIDEIDHELFLWQISDSHSYFTRGHTFRIAKQPCIVNPKKHSFSQRVICDWNALPNGIATAPPINVLITA